MKELIRKAQEHSKGDFLKLINEYKLINIEKFLVDALNLNTIFYIHDEIEGKKIYIERMNQKFKVDVVVSKDKFIECLKLHQQGELNFNEWLEKSISFGVSHWEVNIKDKVCVYYLTSGKVLYEEMVG